MSFYSQLNQGVDCDAEVALVNNRSALMTLAMLAEAPGRFPALLNFDYIAPEQMAGFLRHSFSIANDTDARCVFQRVVIGVQTHMPQMMRLAFASFVLNLTDDEKAMMFDRRDEARLSGAAFVGRTLSDLQLGR